MAQGPPGVLHVSAFARNRVFPRSPSHPCNASPWNAFGPAPRPAWQPSCWALLLCLINQASAAWNSAPGLQRSAVPQPDGRGFDAGGLLWDPGQTTVPGTGVPGGTGGLELINGLHRKALLAELRLGGAGCCLTATPAASVLIHWQGWPILRRGCLQRSAGGPRCQSARGPAKPEKAISLLVNLALYPGPAGVTGYRPAPLAVLIQPIGGGRLAWLLGGGHHAASARPMKPG